ncbi:MAG: hypothetical protein EOO10_17650 [Chitinophagaceae bacterium]|nr:MAG: hypothetical protein EOO10_17650 [Chitinophagaceae bacterium]
MDANFTTFDYYKKGGNTTKPQFYLASNSTKDNNLELTIEANDKDEDRGGLTALVPMAFQTYTKDQQIEHVKKLLDLFYGIDDRLQDGHLEKNVV